MDCLFDFPIGLCLLLIFKGSLYILLFVLCQVYTLQCFPPIVAFLLTSLMVSFDVLLTPAF